MNKFKIKSVDEMSLDELVGQIIMVGLPTTYLDEQYKQFIKDYKIGNYILFARNYHDTEQMKSFMNELYQYTDDITGSFPLVSIDQEGGMVVRLFKDVTFPASPLTTSSTTVENAPYQTGYIIGKDMLQMGLNLNLAPCLEINEELGNPLVNVRSYGGNREIVLQNAGKFVKGLQDSGVLSCVKHFPGSGNASKDSHLELPIIERNQQDLLNTNLYPFLNLTSTDAIMSCHTQFSAFDNVPTTLSYKLLTEVLRQEVGYDGLIISDGMEMKAITDTYGLAQGTLMAVKAGCDILLLCHEYSEQKLALDTLKKAVIDGEISIDLLKEKVRRINKSKEKLVKGLEQYFTMNKYQPNQVEHQLMESIVENSFTLISGDKPQIKGKTLIITSKPNVSSIVEDEFDTRNLYEVLLRNFPSLDIVEFSSNLIEYINENKYDNIIIYSYDAFMDELQIKVINQILSMDINSYLVSLKGPCDQKCFTKIKNYSCLYEYTPNSIKTIVKQLKNEIELNGKLPL